MKKRGILIIFVLCMFASCVFAENWYAITKYHMIGKDGGVFVMRMVTRVYDEETCYRIIEKLIDPNLGKIEWTDTNCVTGEAYDEALFDVFSKSSADETYLYFIDTNGFETVVDFMGVPIELQNALAAKISKRFEAQGVKVLKIIKAREKEECFPEVPALTIDEEREYGLGATKEEVLSLQGMPEAVAGEVWFYGSDYVVFDDEEKMGEYSNIFGTLKIQGAISHTVEVETTEEPKLNRIQKIIMQIKKWVSDKVRRRER